MTNADAVKLQSFKIGMIGEDFVKFWCLTSNRTFKKATAEENLTLGVDCFIESIPTDVKNTDKIYLGNYKGEFFVRHPFRLNSKAENYCILDISNDLNSYRVVYNGSITDYISKFLKPEYTIKDLINILDKYEKKTYRSIGLKSIESMLFVIKKEISLLLNSKAKCLYFNLNEGSLMLTI